MWMKYTLQVIVQAVMVLSYKLATLLSECCLQFHGCSPEGTAALGSLLSDIAPKMNSTFCDLSLWLKRQGDQFIATRWAITSVFVVIVQGQQCHHQSVKLL